ncbi:leucine-rich repeat (LRR) protein 1 [Hibiscus trionum]|uniref:Leucine-rich repeat (LRR) protein 1 n=1 Tax=Hibiscus trionum TaxID=183268 RepID=A0A9W7MIB0_HIBTR|nr:leucine-rich repeat (LRR) protein 1 [Hibiscus trionum]
MTNLQRLSDFVIGEGDGHRIGELKNLSNLGGDFCLSGLENVNGQEAKEARLNEKSGINTLILQWSGDLEKPTRKKEVEERVLDSLRPREKLEQLVIENFCGAKFPSWIVDSSFKKLSSLKLHGCKNCKSLPPIGRLPLLKGLSIGGMDEVHKIGIEFFGEDQSTAFASLQTLSFWGLPNWEEWDACERDDQVSRFPSLRELSIRVCPKLLGRLPTRLHSLQRLVIIECRRLVVSISSYPSLRELSVEGCEELVDECSSSPVEEVASLQSACVSSISKFSIAAERRRLLRFANSNNFGARDFNKLPEALHAFTFLTRMELVRCEGLVCFAESNFSPALKELIIRYCNNLQYLFDESMSSKTCLLEHLEIKSCSSLIWLSSRGDICNRLQHLRISFCQKLRSLFLNSKLPVMLKQLHICGCPALECIVQNFHETTHLEIICILDAENMKSLPRGLDKLSHLQEINLQRCSNLVVCFDEIGFPTTNLKAFHIENCENLVALPRCINNFTSLGKLTVINCGADISFPEEGFPTNLTSLRICKAPRIYSSLVEWGFHKLTSLQHLQIIDEECSNVVSFPEETRGMTLPPSLTSIWISGFKNLEFMCSKGFQHLTSLQYLTISSCPKLTSLPEKDMLLSLGYLSIYSCPLLEEKCRRVKGREWSKISHIPKVEIYNGDVIPLI